MNKIYLLNAHNIISYIQTHNLTTLTITAPLTMKRAKRNSPRSYYIAIFCNLNQVMILTLATITLCNYNNDYSDMLCGGGVGGATLYSGDHVRWSST